MKKASYFHVLFVVYLLWLSPWSKNSTILKGIFDILSNVQRVSIYCKKRAERKLLPFLTLFPISFVFPLFYCVEKQSFKSGLCISLFCTFCVLNVMTNKSRDEPTSLSIASTISLLPPSFSTTGILCFKNTGELDHESCFSSFFGCESSSLLHCTTVEIGKISSRGELDKRQQFRKPCSISQNTLASAVLFFVSNCLNEKLQHHGNCLSNIMCMDLLMGSVQMPLESSMIEKKRDRFYMKGSLFQVLFSYTYISKSTS